MSVDWIRSTCMAMPHATEEVQWGNHLLFKVGGKMFAITGLEHSAGVTFKCTDEEFAELTERPGIIPAPYMARNKWVAVERLDALPRAELKRLLGTSYELVKAKLTKKAQAELGKPAKRPKK